MRLREHLILELAIGKAAVFADKYHKGQHRKSTGEPYIKHPMGTYKILKKIVKDKDLLVAAWLHDTLEDTPVTYNDLKKEFNKTVADLVQGVTSDKKALKFIDKPQYLLNKMIKMSDNALSIKLADRLHNLDDITTASAGFAEKMYTQTTYIMQELRNKRSLNPAHKKLIRLIDKALGKYK